MTASAIPLGARLTAAVLDRSPDWPAFAATKAMGAMARLRLPKPVVGAAVSMYSRYFDVEWKDVDEAARATGFTSFDAFFTRRLRADARPIEQSDDILVAPCDGRLRGIDDIADVEDKVVAKGHAYTLGELIEDDALARSFVGGRLVTIYLHPRDYHRVHAPVAGTITRVRSIPGRLLPVTDAALRREPRLFARNERLVHVFDTHWGPVVVVMIAAFGVGHMTCAYTDVDPHPRTTKDVLLDPPCAVQKGEELGRFHLGSTVVVLLPPGCEPLPETPADGAAVRFGQRLLHWEHA